MNAALRIFQILGLMVAIAWAGPPVLDWADRRHAAWQAREFWKATLAGEGTSWADCRLPSGETAEYWLSLPAVGIETLVVSGADDESLNRYAALVTSGNEPAEQGRGLVACPASGPASGARVGPLVITAHRDLHFRPLKDLAEGHEFTLQDPTGATRRFRIVTEEVVPKDRLPQHIRQTAPAYAAALVTCHPFYYVGPAPGRYIAWADEVTKNALPAQAADVEER